MEELSRASDDPTVSGVVLTGPAGVGKTRLGDELLVAAAGKPTARAVGHVATRRIPLGAFAQLLPLEVTAGTEVGEDARRALFHRARSHLSRTGGEQRLVLLIDDVDQLDAISLALLLPLTLDGSVFVIATIRSGRTVPEVLATLLKDGRLRLEQVPPLTIEEVATLLQRVLDGPVDAETVERLASASGGNLQVLRELLQQSLEHGELLKNERAWRLVRLSTSARLDMLVAGQVADLAPGEDHCLELVAVAGSVGLEDLRVHVDIDILERMEGRGLIAVARDGRRVRVTLAHPVYGEVIRGRMSQLRIQAVMRALADRLEHCGIRRRADVVQCALWRLEGGGRVATELLIDAARQALLGHDDRLAARFAAAAAAQGGAHDAALVTVEVAGRSGDPDAVERAAADVWADPALPDGHRSTLARRRAASRFWRGDLLGSLAILEEADSVLVDSVARAGISAQRALLLANNGRPDDALELVGVAGPAADPRTRMEQLAATSIALLSTGRFGAAIDAARAGLRAHDELPPWSGRRGRSVHLINEAHALCYSGRYEEARRLIEPARPSGAVTHPSAATVWFDIVLGEIERDSGHGTAAARYFQAAVDQAAAVGQQAALVWARVGVAQAALLLGDGASAATALAESVAIESPVATSQLTHDRARAWLLACDGDLHAARRLLGAVVSSSRRAHLSNFEVGAVHDLVRFGDASSAVDRLAELAQVVEGPYVGACAAHARAAVTGDPDDYGAAIELFADMGCLVLGAEACLEASEVHRRNGEPRRATALARRSAQLVREAGGARTPGLRRGHGVEPLTGRERQVALLAASGLTSRGIAERLGVSNRTVDSHLERAYRKLGVTGRGQLEAALGGEDRTG